MKNAATRTVTGMAIGALFLASSAFGQLDASDLAGNGTPVLKAPYRGPVTSWREAHMQLGFGDVINYKIFRQDPADTATVDGWNENDEYFRVFMGWDASGAELSPGNQFLDSHLVTDDGPTPYWPLSIKAIGTRSGTESPSLTIVVGTSQGQNADCDYGSGVFDQAMMGGAYACCADSFLFDPGIPPFIPGGEYCAMSCTDPCGCNDTPSCVASGIGTTLYLRVAPSVIDPQVSERHAWYPGMSVLELSAGVADLVVTVNEATNMIGQSFLILPTPGSDTYKEQVSREVRLPGMPETTFLQPKEHFTPGGPGNNKLRIGTPWPGHMVGWWVEGAPTTIDPNLPGYPADLAANPFDVRGPDGTIYRFAEPPAPGKIWPTAYLSRIIPPGIDPVNPTAYVDYEYYNPPVGDDTYVWKITDHAGHSIQLNRDPTTGDVTSIETNEIGSPTWVVSTDANGWISQIDPPGGQGTRSYVHSTDGRLLEIHGDDGTLRQKFDFDANNEILTEWSYFDGTASKVASYDYTSSTSWTETLHPDTDPANDRTITCVYDDTDNGLLDRIDVAGAVVDYVWYNTNDRGTVNLRWTTLPGGPASTPSVQVSYGYRSTSDVDGFPHIEQISIQDIDVYDVEYEYNVGDTFHRVPRIVQSWDSEGNETTYEYDPGVTDFNRLIRVTGPAIPIGFSPGSAVTEYTYYADGDARDGLLKETKIQVSDTTWRVTLYEYDAARRLTKMTVDPGGENLVTDYAAPPDAALRVDGQPTLVADPRGYLVRYTYDPAGRLTRTDEYLQADASAGASYETISVYGNDGLLAHMDRPIRDQDGALLAAEGTQRTKYTRDGLSRVTKVEIGKAAGPSDVDPNESLAQDYRYNNLGELVRTTHQDGLYERLTYNNRGLLQQRIPGYSDGTGADTDYSGMAVTYVYDNAGRLDKVNHASGWEVDYSQQRDAYGRVKRIAENPLGAVTSLEYDRNSRITSETVVDGLIVVSQVARSWDHLQRPYREVHFATNTSSSAQVTLTRYRRDGLPDRILSRGAHPCTGIDNGPDELEANTSIDPPFLGDHYVDYAYDTAGRLVQMSEPSDQVQCPMGIVEMRVATLTLDDAGNTTAVQVKNQDETIQRTTSIVFDALGRATALTPSTGAAVNRSYNSLSLPIEITGLDTTLRGGGPIAQTQFDHDAVGRLQAIADIDPTAPTSISTTTFAYYPSTSGNAGRLHQITNPVGVASTLSYQEAMNGPAGELRSRTVTDGEANATTTTLDTAGRVTRLLVDEPVAGGGPSSLVRSLDFLYANPLGLEMEIRRNNNPSSSILQTRNVLGYVTRVEDLRSVPHTAQVDQGGRITQVVEAEGILPRTSRATIGRLGLNTVTFNPGGGSNDQTTSYFRTPGGLVRAIDYPDSTAGSNTAKREYNVFGERTRTIDQNGVDLAVAIDNSGQRQVIATVAGDEYVYEFDGLSRLVTATHRVSAVDVSSVEYIYDGHGNLREERQSLGSSAYTTKYTYNAAGQTIGITYPCDGDPCTNAVNLEARGAALDGLGRPTQVDFNGQALVDYVWEGQRLKKQTAYSPTGAAQPLMELTVSFDEHARQQQREWKGWDNGALSKIIESTQYEYDAGDYVTHVTSNLPGRSSAIVTDALGRLTNLVRGTDDGMGNVRAGSEILVEDRTQEPGIDLLGNLLKTVTRLALPTGGYQLVQTVVQSINDANEITQYDRIVDGNVDAVVDLVYDHAGNLLADGSQYYRYDGLNKLIEVGEQGDAVLDADGNLLGGTLGPPLATFTYDAVGRRLTQEIHPAAAPRLPAGVAVGTRRYLYGGDRLLEVRDAATGEILKRHFYSPEGLDTRLRTDDYVADPDPGEFASFFYATDRLGSPMAAVAHDPVADEAAVVERFIFDAQGNRTTTTGEPVCLSTDVNCDGVVGAVDLVLVREAFGPVVAGTPEDMCGPGGSGPDLFVDNEDLSCVRADLGRGPGGGVPPGSGLPLTDQTLGLHGLTVDPATGLVYARARYFSPALGRWTQRDPTGYTDGGSLYEAFGSHPYAHRDPMGTELDAVGNLRAWTEDTTSGYIDVWFDEGWFSSERKIMRLVFDVKRDRERTKSWITIGDYRYLVNTMDLREWFKETADDALEATLWSDAREPSERFIAQVLADSFFQRFGDEFDGIETLSGKVILDSWAPENIGHKANRIRRGLNKAGAMAEAGMKDVMYGFLFAAGAEVVSRGVQVARSTRRFSRAASAGARPQRSVDSVLTTGKNATRSGPASVRIRTGQSGELRSAFTRIEPGNLGQGTATNASSRAFVRRLGNVSDDAGHAVGKNLGGLGGARSGNIFPQAPSVNRGSFNQFEQQIARRVRAGDTVLVRVVPRYEPGATRPFEILYQARINGRTVSRVFPNP